MKRTNKDLKIKKGLYCAIPGCEVDVPKGSLATWIKHCNGWYISPNVFQKGSMDQHDATYYGFRVAEEDLEDA